jgi:hypothetical protein
VVKRCGMIKEYCPLDLSEYEKGEVRVDLVRLFLMSCFPRCIFFGAWRKDHDYGVCFDKFRTDAF